MSLWIVSPRHRTILDFSFSWLRAGFVVPVQIICLHPREFFLFDTSNPRIFRYNYGYHVIRVLSCPELLIPLCQTLWLGHTLADWTPIDVSDKRVVLIYRNKGPTVKNKVSGALSRATLQDDSIPCIPRVKFVWRHQFWVPPFVAQSEEYMGVAATWVPWYSHRDEQFPKPGG